MPSVHFFHDYRARLGKLFGGHLVDLSTVAPHLPTDMVGFLAAGEEALDVFHEVDDGEKGMDLNPANVSSAGSDFPARKTGIGMNYRDHAAEAIKAGVETPPYQLWFNKQVSCITGPFDDVVKPGVSEKLDYEAELAVVIGRKCRHVDAENARSVIGGYMVANDVSARDWQLRTPTHTLGKSFDTHGPIGPWLVLDHEIEDPHALDIRMYVNGEQRQRGNTGSMIYNIFDQIAYLSTVMTLKPGDILATGLRVGSAQR